jgi:ubiquinone/menaquinone biosynthesis C-methylase UbiE
MTSFFATPRLLPQEDLVATNPVDHADWNYRPLLGSIQRWRFRLIMRLLEGLKIDGLLEIGYGSGVFIPELVRHCRSIAGIDPHPRHAEVMEVLKRHGIQSDLRSASAESIPFADASFDCIVSVSALEYIPDIEIGCREMLRVLKPGGYLIAVTPGFSPLVDFGLRIMTGEQASQYGDRRARLLPSLHRNFTLDRRLQIPPFGGRYLRLYSALRMRKPPL